MTPQSAVARLAEIIVSRPELTVDEVFAAMAEAGIPDSVARGAYIFTQVAWGRVLLNGLGVRCSPEYTCFNGAGEVVERGRLADQPYFAAATAEAGRYVGTSGFKQLALMAAEVRALNELLHQGSKPENIVTTAQVLFMEPPTPAGMERVKQHLSRTADGPKKPWWRFWQRGKPA